ncbi:succinate dehydrogenase cytochrome b subunit [Gordonia rhizosphera]|uniref:Putative succinate dehydrogenase cytochrome b subunit n=1 Tax=Gordonia rhizosphera NBRC 16068 TaxID=1108045 RepID=K6WTT0_9ACTN|nr:succinate dehydrogenase cytochrome b subunit [Gordonia rhizosphera]GAB89969.1 putative succinate dehydrogenase cytochrome b subunit [Gordonia rhizosphera NBRC 16068]
MSTVIPPHADPPRDSTVLDDPDAPTPTPRAAAVLSPVPRRHLTDVTLKVTMALTGTVFALFVLVHMIGNLKVYTGAEHFDAYAHWLRTLAEPLLPYEGALWIFRLVLLACLVAHVGASALLIARAYRAKGRFRRRGLRWRRWPAMLMPYTGLVLLAFIVFHILDLTVGAEPVASDQFIGTTPDTSHAYHNLVESFERWPVAVFYVVTMVLLGLHLVHGLWSVVNDLGITGQRVRQAGAALAVGLAAVVMIGNITIPAAVLTGLVS